MTFETELAFARDAARAGGELALRSFGDRPAARRKADGTWVTEADEAVEAEMRRRIREAFPDHNVLGEEDGLRAATGGPPTPGAPTWVVDPIDGTSNYISGIPIWAVLVALRIDEVSVVGVAHAPALSETYEAARGGGALMNGNPIAVRPVDALEEATVLLGSAFAFAEAGLERFLASLLALANRDRGVGDFWGHLLVARGAAHAMVDAARLSLWDVAALEPIIAEAGALMSGPSGEPWRAGEACMTSCGPALHKAVLDLFTDSERATPLSGIECQS